MTARRPRKKINYGDLITSNLLKRSNACEAGVEEFNKLYLAGVQFTDENILEASLAGLDVIWLFETRKTDYKYTGPLVSSCSSGVLWYSDGLSPFHSGYVPNQEIPAFTEFCNGKIIRQEWCGPGTLGRKIAWRLDGKVVWVHYTTYIDDGPYTLHREDGPSAAYFNADGSISNMRWDVNGESGGGPSGGYAILFPRDAEPSLRTFNGPRPYQVTPELQEEIDRLANLKPVAVPGFTDEMIARLCG